MSRYLQSVEDTTQASKYGAVLFDVLSAVPGVTPVPDDVRNLAQTLPGATLA